MFVGYALVSKSGENIQSTFVSETLMKFSVFPCLNVKLTGFYGSIFLTDLGQNKYFTLLKLK